MVDGRNFVLCETETVFCSDIKPKMFSTEMIFLPSFVCEIFYLLPTDKCCQFYAQSRERILRMCACKTCKIAEKQKQQRKELREKKSSRE